MPWWSSGRGLLPTLPPGRSPSARAAALVGGRFLTEEDLSDVVALRTEDVPLFPSRDFAFLTDDEAADWRVVVWRPTVVVLSDDGVCRADEDALCLVDDEVFREVEELLLADDEDCLDVDEDCLADDEDCLSEEDERLADDEDCLSVDEDVDVRRLWAYPSVWNAASAMNIAATAARYVLIKIVFAETYMPEALCSMVIHSVHRLSVEPIFL